MCPETLATLLRELATEIPLPAEDWEAILSHAQRIQEAIVRLDELGLDAVEPATVFQLTP